MKLKDYEGEVIYSDDLFYDLFTGGYIKPEQLLEDEDAQEVRKAMDVIEDFLGLVIYEGIVEVE